MTEKTKLQREKKIEEAREELIKKYGEPMISGTEEVVEQVEKGARIETVSTYLSRGIREKRGTIKEISGITKKGVVKTRQKCEGQIIGAGVLSIGTEFWVIPSEFENKP